MKSPEALSSSVVGASFMPMASAMALLQICFYPSGHTDVSTAWQTKRRHGVLTRGGWETQSTSVLPGAPCPRRSSPPLSTFRRRRSGIFLSPCMEMLLSSVDTTTKRGFGEARRRVPCGKVQCEGPDGVHIQVVFDFANRGVGNRAPMVSNSGVCDDGVQLRDTKTRLKLLYSLLSIRG